MTYDQYLDSLKKKGIDPNEYIRRVSLLFFCADLADSISLEMATMMAPEGTIDGNIKHHVSKIRQHAAALIRHSDRVLNPDCQEGFANDGDTFKTIAYEWARITK